MPGIAEGPIVSFLPIFVMGVLFGLAMDYEMFLVSAMREEFVRDGDPRAAVLRGFRASAPVVTAAALIMTSVFVAFVPGGSSTIKPIALGLAVGVFVDAFVVRMTFVPAVLALLGRACVVAARLARAPGARPSTSRARRCTDASRSSGGRPSTVSPWSGPRGSSSAPATRRSRSAPSRAG